MTMNIIHGILHTDDKPAQHQKLCRIPELPKGSFFCCRKHAILFSPVPWAKHSWCCKQAYHPSFWSSIPPWSTGKPILAARRVLVYISIWSVPIKIKTWAVEEVSSGGIFEIDLTFNWSSNFFTKALLGFLVKSTITVAG